MPAVGQRIHTDRFACGCIDAVNIAACAVCGQYPLARIHTLQRSLRIRFISAGEDLYRNKRIQRTALLFNGLALAAAQRKAEKHKAQRDDSL